MPTAQGQAGHPGLVSTNPDITTAKRLKTQGPALLHHSAEHRLLAAAEKAQQASRREAAQGESCEPYVQGWDPLAHLAELALAIEGQPSSSLPEPEPDTFMFSLQGELISAHATKRRNHHARSSDLVHQYLTAQPLTREQLNVMEHLGMIPSTPQGMHSSKAAPRSNKVGRAAIDAPGVSRPSNVYVPPPHAKIKSAAAPASTRLPGQSAGTRQSKEPMPLSQSRPPLPAGPKPERHFNLLRAAMSRKLGPFSAHVSQPTDQHKPPVSPILLPPGATAQAVQHSPAAPQPWLHPDTALMTPIVSLPAEDEQAQAPADHQAQPAAPPTRTPLQSVTAQRGAGRSAWSSQSAGKQAVVLISDQAPSKADSKQQWARPVRGYTSKAEAADLVRKVVDVPGYEFDVDVPGLYYRARVEGPDKQHANAVVIKMLDDGSRYYFSIGQVRHWYKETLKRYADDAAADTAVVGAKRARDAAGSLAAHVSGAQPSSSVSEHSHSDVPVHAV